MCACVRACVRARVEYFTVSFLPSKPASPTLPYIYIYIYSHQLLGQVTDILNGDRARNTSARATYSRFGLSSATGIHV